MLKLFSVYDQKSESYSTPFPAKTIGEAERSFAEEAKNPNSLVSKYPTDYNLFYIGDFCQETCEVIPNSKQLISSAFNLLEKQL